MSQEDQQFAEFLVKDLQYYDTALRYLDSLDRKLSMDDPSRAEILSLRIDIYGAQGDQAAKMKTLEELKKKYPNSPRALGGDIAIIRDNLRSALAKFDEAAVEPDAKKAEKLMAEGAKRFVETVEKPLDAAIADIEARLAEFRKKAEASAPPKEKKGKGRIKSKTSRQISPEEDALLLSRDQYELQRIGIYISYLEKLPEKSKERQQMFDKALKLATEFVDKRVDFPVMRYHGQLQLGIILLTMGRYEQAEANLSVLYSIEPPEAAKPFGKVLVEAFRTLRIQAILFGTRALNSAGAYPKAAKIVERFYLQSPKDLFNISAAEASPELRPFAVLLQLEYAIALAGAGEAKKGLDEVQKIIARYSGVRATGSSAVFVTDARKALGRIAAMANVGLRGEDYYQAGLGLKSDRKLEEALIMFQRALGRLDPRNTLEYQRLAPLCLNEIGETLIVMKRFVEASLAYREVAHNFKDLDAGLAGKVAQNFLGTTTFGIQATPEGASHAGLKALKAEASKYSEAMGQSFALVRATVFDASTAEDQGKYREAMLKYREVPQTLKGEKVPFYWYARAKEFSCLYSMWDQADATGKQALEGEIVKAIGELPKVIEAARKDKEKEGMAIASLTLGRIQFQRGEWDEAISAFKIFTDESVGGAVRCVGVLSLVLAEVNAGALDAADGHYKVLEKTCKDDPGLGQAAMEIADGYEVAGDLKNAARYMLIFAKLPASQKDLENIDTLVQVAARLIDGGMIAESQTYVDKAKAMATPDDPKLARQLIYLESKVLAYEKKWNEVIAKLEGYVSKFRPDGVYYEDPYVLRDLGDAYLARSAPKTPPLEDIQQAERAYNMACALMRDRRTLDPTNEKTFWVWTLKFLKIDGLIGDAGDTNAYRQIIQYVDDNEKTDMGGLKEEFLKLKKEAAAKLSKGS